MCLYVSVDVGYGMEKRKNRDSISGTERYFFPDFRFPPLCNEICALLVFFRSVEL